MAILTKKRMIWALSGVVLAGLVGGGLVARASKKAPGSEAKNAPVTLEFAAADLTRVEFVALRPQLRVSGSLQPLRQTIIKAKVPGEIRMLGPREGDAVRAGQVLARLDTAELETRLAEKVGNLESGRAQLALAEKTRANTEALLAQGFISQSAYDNAVTAFDANRGTQQVWEAQVQLARNAVRDATIVAPLGGVVARRHVQAGERVNIDAPVYTVVDLAELEMQAPVPTVDVPLLKPGMSVDLRIDGFGSEGFRGRISRINPATELGTRSILVHIALANPGGRLKGGMFASGAIELAATQPVPTLPTAAVRTEAGEAYAWTLQDGRLVRRALVLGQRDHNQGRVEVTSGVTPEIWVLAGKIDLIKEGQAARIKGATSMATATHEPGAAQAPAAKTL